MRGRTPCGSGSEFPEKLQKEAGRAGFGRAAFEVLKANPAMSVGVLPERLVDLTPDIASRYDGVYITSHKVTRASLARGDRRLKIIARHGVGCDSIDVPAMAELGVLVTNTPLLAIRRPMAVAALTMIFAVSQHLLDKDRLVREGRWFERTNFMGVGLRTRTLGLIGAGGIGQEIMSLAKPFFRRMIVADPFGDVARIGSLGASLAPLGTVMAESDFLVCCCLLTDETRHLVNVERLSLMKQTAFVVNVARGPIVDERALVEALKGGRIAGAGLDVYEQEPIASDNPLEDPAQRRSGTPLAGVDRRMLPRHGRNGPAKPGGFLARAASRCTSSIRRHRLRESQPPRATAISRDSALRNSATSWPMHTQPKPRANAAFAALPSGTTHPSGLPAAGAGVFQRVFSGRIAQYAEGLGASKAVRQVIVPEPSHVDPRHAEDVGRGFNPFGGTRSARSSGPIVRGRHFRHGIAARVPVVRKAEGEAAPPRGAIAAGACDRFSLLARLDERNHNSHRPGIEDRRDQVVETGRRAHHRDDVRRRRKSTCCLIVSMPTPECSMSSRTNCGGGEDRQQARREKLERHDASAVSPRRSLSRTGLPAIRSLRISADFWRR